MSDLPAANRLTARTDKEAVARFLQGLDAALTALTPDAHWFVANWAVTTNPSPLPFLDRSGELIYLRSTMRFDIVDDQREGHDKGRKVRTLAYAHTLSRDENLDLQMLSWEWHGDDDLRWPHVHIDRVDRHAPEPMANGDNGEALAKLHVPTGRVHFEDVLLFLLHDFEVVVDDRESADKILREWSSRTRAFRSWS